MRQAPPCLLALWLAHTVRGAIAGALKKTLGLSIVSEKPAKNAKRVYRMA